LLQAAVEQGGSHRKRDQRGGSQPNTALEQYSILERDDSHDSVAIPSLNCRTTRAYPEVNSSVEIYQCPVGKPGSLSDMQAPLLDCGSRRLVRRLGQCAIKRSVGRSLLDLAVETRIESVPTRWRRS
jgi:hypothetical protein